MGQQTIAGRPDADTPWVDMWALFPLQYYMPSFFVLGLLFWALVEHWWVFHFLKIPQPQD